MQTKILRPALQMESILIGQWFVDLFTKFLKWKIIRLSTRISLQMRPSWNWIRTVLLGSILPNLLMVFFIVLALDNIISFKNMRNHIVYFSITSHLIFNSSFISSLF